MAEKLYQLGLTLAGTVAASLTKSFSKADNALSDYDRSVIALKTHQYDLDRVMKQRQATLQAAQAYATILISVFLPLYPKSPQIYCQK